MNRKALPMLIPMNQARIDLCQLVNRSLDGIPTLLTRYGKPVAVITALTPAIEVTLFNGAPAPWRPFLPPTDNPESAGPDSLDKGDAAHA
jgi:antitoxin (DNA-binding transcriptional repressor) of toxin-antitoxin stability system